MPIKKDNPLTSKIPIVQFTGGIYYSGNPPFLSNDNTQYDVHLSFQMRDVIEPQKRQISWGKQWGNSTEKLTNRQTFVPSLAANEQFLSAGQRVF